MHMSFRNTQTHTSHVSRRSTFPSTKGMEATSPPPGPMGSALDKIYMSAPTYDFRTVRSSFHTLQLKTLHTVQPELYTGFIRLSTSQSSPALTRTRTI